MAVPQRKAVVLKIPSKKMTSMLGLMLWVMMVAMIPKGSSSSWQDNIRPIMYVQLGKCQSHSLSTFVVS